MKISWGYVGSFQEPALGISKECLEFSERYENRTSGVGPGLPTLGAKPAERFRGMCKVAPQAAGNQVTPLVRMSDRGKHSKTS
ncbi:UNVERIFIED_CONTAM: hypothetical protein Sradi_2087700 [Sesamum radiatum]|uniref:Uncharacterized protein n=1 Tax=Sesamum radiatum TaxID=300843 RepID=A0AAW2TIQ1_SESRA